MIKENPCYHCYAGASGQCDMTRCKYQHEPWSQDVESIYIEDNSGGDTVSRAVFEQIMWERNVAIQQLQDLGYGLGEMPREGEWLNGSCGDYVCSACKQEFDCDIANIRGFNFKFCPNCGARMR